MIVVENTIISDIITEKHFCCDITKCQGACCIEGDAGAPLESKEVDYLISHFEKIKPYMTVSAVSVVEDSGVFDYDSEGNYVTPLLNNKECVFLYYEDKIAKCCIEKAFFEKKINFQKPVSCHLYPIRITEYTEFKAINYHQWHICDAAIPNGKKTNLLIYQFLKEPLIRKFGKKWYKKLEKEIENKKS
jgi:hypothetical protein